MKKAAGKAIRNVIFSVVLGVGVAITLLATSTALNMLKEASAEPTIFNEVGQHTYKMLDPDNLGSGGTGFEVQADSGRTYIMTNAHVCNISKYSYIVGARAGDEIRYPIVNISKEADLCLVETLPNRTGLKVAKSVSFGQHVFLVGHPMLQPLTIKSGYLTDRQLMKISYCNALRAAATKFGFIEDLFEENCIKEVDANLATMDSMPGNSGSAVTNSNGEVIGVLFAGNATGLSLLVPLDRIQEYLRKF